MNTQYDLYITFPDELVTKNEHLSNLISNYLLNLMIITERILSRKLKIVVKEKDFNNNNYRNCLEASSLFLFFSHPFFEDFQDYNNELAEMCDYLQIDQVDPLKGISKVFRINLEPDKNSSNSSCLDRLNSYNFYEKNIYNKKIKSLELDTTGGKNLIYSKFLDLAYDISSSIRNGQLKETDDTTVSGSVYLGMTSIDQQESREEIRRELQQLGYSVLPLVNMPAVAEDFEKVLVKNLDHSNTVVQIMGTQYGEIVKGTKYSLIDFQNKLIREYQEKNPGHNLMRYIWIPAGTKINDQRQALYLKRIKRDDAGVNAEIIESPLETFKTILLGRLTKSRESAKIRSTNIAKVYLITEDEISKEPGSLYEVLSMSGLKVLTLDFSEQIGIFARHLQLLRDCDSVIIYQQKENSYWLNSKIRDIIKSAGIGRIQPFKKVLVLSKSKMDNELLKLIRAKVELIPDLNIDEDIIPNKLISE